MAENESRLTEAQETDWYEKHRATGLIRLLTRLIFCWFLKEKGLIPETLFDEQKLVGILKSLYDDEPTYHQAILQNLFEDDEIFSEIEEVLAHV